MQTQTRAPCRALWLSATGQCRWIVLPSEGRSRAIQAYVGSGQGSVGPENERVVLESIPAGAVHPDLKPYERGLIAYVDEAAREKECVRNGTTDREQITAMFVPEAAFSTEEDVVAAVSVVYGNVVLCAVRNRGARREEIDLSAFEEFIPASIRPCAGRPRLRRPLLRLEHDVAAGGDAKAGLF